MIVQSQDPKSFDKDGSDRELVRIKDYYKRKIKKKIMESKLERKRESVLEKVCK